MPLPWEEQYTPTTQPPAAPPRAPRGGTDPAAPTTPVYTTSTGTPYGVPTTAAAQPTNTATSWWQNMMNLVQQAAAQAPVQATEPEPPKDEKPSLAEQWGADVAAQPSQTDLLRAEMGQEPFLKQLIQAVQQPPQRPLEPGAADLLSGGLRGQTVGGRERLTPQEQRDWTDRQQAERRAEREANQLQRRTARAQEILAERGVMPMINSSIGSMQGQMVMAPTTNPQYQIELNKLLNRWDRRNALAPEDRANGNRGDENRPRDKREVEAMTWDEYNALSTAERAAVDFNTSLVQAVRQDRKANRQGLYDDVTDEQRDTYTGTVERLLGEAPRENQLYAPETVALLNQLDLTDQTATLNDFLKLKVAITEDDMKEIAAWETRVTEGGRYEGEPVSDRTQYQIELADATTDLQATLAEGDKLLQSWRATADAARIEDVGFYSGLEQKPNLSLGWGPSWEGDPQTGSMTIDGFFQSQFDNLANANADSAYISQTLADTAAQLSPEELKKFYGYIDQRSRDAVLRGDWAGTTIQQNPGIQYRTPQEFRQALGLDKVRG